MALLIVAACGRTSGPSAGGASASGALAGGASASGALAGGASASGAAPIVSAPIVSATSAESRPGAACFPAAFATAALRSTQLAGASLTVCLDGREVEGGEAAGYPCLELDLTTRAVRAAPAAPEPSPDASFGPPGPPPSKHLVRSTASAVTVCNEATKACKTVPIGPATGAKVGHGGSEDDALIAAVSDDGERLAVLVPERVPSVPEQYAGSYRVFVATYDVASGRRLSRTLVRPAAGGSVALFSDPSDAWRVRWLGPRLWLSAHRCCGPDGVEALFEPKTGALEYLGDPSLWQRVGSDRWLIGNEEYGRGEGAPGGVSLSFVDRQGRRRPPLRLPSRPRHAPETFVLAAHPAGDGTLAVVHANPPGVAWVDTRREALVAHVPLPLCPL